jgi:hypothetical protein
MDDPELRARLGAAGRAYVREHFDWATIAARVLAGYDAALAMRTSAASVLRFATPDQPPPPPEMPPTPAAPTEAEGQIP